MTGVTGGATYEHGSVPVVGCLSNAGTPTLTLSAITGPFAEYGVGTQTATCTLAGIGSAFATYTIVDTTAPEFDLPDDIVVNPGRNTASAVARAIVAMQVASVGVTYTASATDAVSGPAPITCTPPSGSIFPVGTTIVTCTATDLVGNPGSGTFTVTVLGGTGGRPSGGDDDEVLGGVISRGSPKGSGDGGGDVLAAPKVKGSLLPFTGSAALVTFLLIGLLLIATGIGSATTSRRRRVEPRDRLL